MQGALACILYCGGNNFPGLILPFAGNGEFSFLKGPCYNVCFELERVIRSASGGTVKYVYFGIMCLWGY